jgi:hypothetical protein
MTKTTHSGAFNMQAAGETIVHPAFRSPRRVTITLPFATYQDLQVRADEEGRSLSNLAAFLLESSLHDKGDAQAANANNTDLVSIFR